MFVAAVPAMYHLGLMTTPKQDIGRLFLLTAITAFYGLFFAVPLRKYYIREPPQKSRTIRRIADAFACPPVQQKLVFPTPTATAFTIQSLHATTTQAARKTANKKITVIASSFSFSLIFKSISSYAPGLLWDWHIFWWLSKLGIPGTIALESWGWWIGSSAALHSSLCCFLTDFHAEFTPAFLSAGALSGLNASWSFLGGSILAWGVLGPLTVATGAAVGQPVDAANYPGWKSYSMRLMTHHV